MERVWIFPVSIAALLALMVALLGTTITDTGGWYQTLAKPGWAPPDAAYGAIWTLVYTSAALACVTGWRATESWRARETWLGLFALNGFVNLLWSLFIFRLHRPDWAVAAAVALFVSAALLVGLAIVRSRAAALLLLPYLCWSGLVAGLTLAIVEANGPFR